MSSRHAACVRCVSARTFHVRRHACVRASYSETPCARSVTALGDGVDGDAQARPWQAACAAIGALGGKRIEDADGGGLVGRGDGGELLGRDSGARVGDVDAQLEGRAKARETGLAAKREQRQREEAARRQKKRERLVLG